MDTHIREPKEVRDTSALVTKSYLPFLIAICCNEHHLLRRPLRAAACLITIHLIHTLLCHLLQKPYLRFFHSFLVLVTLLSFRRRFSLSFSLVPLVIFGFIVKYSTWTEHIFNLIRTFLLQLLSQHHL